MKIGDKILSLPPYLSTPWKNVVALRLEPSAYGPLLIVDLATGGRVEVPNLDRTTIEKIFDIHSTIFEEAKKPELTFLIPQEPLSLMQHNMDQASSPDLPKGILKKTAEMIKSMGMIDLSMLPKPEPHCNCPHCQILKALQEPAAETPPIEEVVSDAELQFQTWKIVENGPKLYTVTNKLDGNEQYTVFLGEPVGCTCGEKGCEHIQAVLRS